MYGAGVGFCARVGTRVRFMSSQASLCWDVVLHKQGYRGVFCCWTRVGTRVCFIQEFLCCVGMLFCTSESTGVCFNQDFLCCVGMLFCTNKGTGVF